MDNATYERLSSETMDTLYDHLEALVEEWGPEGTHGWEIEYSSGVLTLGLGPHGTYVINKQPPNQQIWLSSPFSGPARFSYAPQGAWIHVASAKACHDVPTVLPGKASERCCAMLICASICLERARVL
ncbi:Mitochondrial matrix iron chaperone [Naganishia albida]|nr:Mitochondrial matrix iron chaperone [Naganishia albida]